MIRNNNYYYLLVVEITASPYFLVSFVSLFLKQLIESPTIEAFVVVFVGGGGGVVFGESTKTTD